MPPGQSDLRVKLVQRLLSPTHVKRHDRQGSSAECQHPVKTLWRVVADYPGAKINVCQGTFYGKWLPLFHFPPRLPSDMVLLLSLAQECILSPECKGPPNMWNLALKSRLTSSACFASR